MPRTKTRKVTRKIRRKSTKRTDPFAGAKPIKDLSVLLGGLPDDRTAEEILDDLGGRHRRRPSA